MSRFGASVSDMGEAVPDRSQGVATVHRTALAVARRNSNAGINARAEDIAQDAVLRYLAQDPATIDHLVGWSRAVANRIIVDLIRAEHRPDDGYNPDRLENADHHVHRDPNAEAIQVFLRDTNVLTTSEQAYVRSTVAAIQAMLSPREMELLVRVASGQTHAQIAAAMDYKNARTVTTKASQIKSKVIDAIGGQEYRDDWMGHQRAY